MGGEYSFDDYILERDRSEEFAPSEVEAINRAMAREEMGREIGEGVRPDGRD